jgi:radical SAM superfamily enzyme with C-terminal helix-hairpin-helix motif
VSDVVILNCYTVEPSGLGVPLYLSGYGRDAFTALRRARPEATVRYLTIDDVRWCLNGGRPLTEPPLSDAQTYSATVGRDSAIQLLRDAQIVVVVAGARSPTADPGCPPPDHLNGLPAPDQPRVDEWFDERLSQVDNLCGN